MPNHDADVILVGAGLANGLIALRLRQLRPELRVIAFDQVAGSPLPRTWSFFATDVSPATLAVLAPLTRARWPGYEVRFPDHSRSIETPYFSIDDRRLREEVGRSLGDGLHQDLAVTEVGPDRVITVDGRAWTAPLVIDGRGAAPSRNLWLAWQKFRGVELLLKRPHGLTRPVIMDACVRQADGYRFVYVLPFDDKTLLVEDTRYSEDPNLDAQEVEADALRFARAQGWCAAEILRRETGVLPITLGGDIRGFWADQPRGLPLSGIRAALFHPTTGYSLPEAATLAGLVARAPKLTSPAIRDLVERRSRRLWAKNRYNRALNRMLFLAAQPEERWRVLSRFYRLPKPLIERFYAGRSTLPDRLRLVAGKPPVPVADAMAALVARPG